MLPLEGTPVLPAPRGTSQTLVDARLLTRVVGSRQPCSLLLPPCAAAKLPLQSKYKSHLMLTAEQGGVWWGQVRACRTLHLSVVLPCGDAQGVKMRAGMRLPGHPGPPLCVHLLCLQPTWLGMGSRVFPSSPRLQLAGGESISGQAATPSGWC